MILISHRGNIHGQRPDRENHPDYIRAALQVGFECEVDVWCRGGQWFLGHDAPQYDIEESFLRRGGLWCHAKDADALVNLRRMGDPVHFWHQEDKYTLTSNGYIWVYPGQWAGDGCILVALGLPGDMDRRGLAGVCSDYIAKWRT